MVPYDENPGEIQYHACRKVLKHGPKASWLKGTRAHISWPNASWPDLSGRGREIHWPVARYAADRLDWGSTIKGLLWRAAGQRHRRKQSPLRSRPLGRLMHRGEGGRVYLGPSLSSYALLCLFLPFSPPVDAIEAFFLFSYALLCLFMPFSAPVDAI